MRAKFYLYCLLIASLYLFAHQLAMSQRTVIYVSASSGSDSTGDGSVARPFKTITKAISGATSGSTIRVAAGLYDQGNGETFPIWMKDGVDLVGDGQDTTVITGIGIFAGGAFDRWPAVIVGADAVISSFRIVIPAAASGTRPPSGIFGSRNTQIRNNVITSTRATLASRGIQEGGGSVLIVNNHIFNNPVGISASPSSLTIKGTLIESNGVGIETIAQSVEISDNTIRNNGGYGIATGSGGAKIVQNVIVGNGNTGLFVYHPSGTSIDASGNTWNPDVQGADSTGQFAPQIVMGPISLQSGGNFAVQNGGATILLGPASARPRRRP